MTTDIGEELPETEEAPAPRDVGWHAAEARQLHAAQLVLDRLDHINVRLAELSALAKELQPKAEGAILLEFYPCGPGCLGCPHHRWIRWVVDRRHEPPRWMGVRIGDPSKMLKRSGRFEECYPHMLELVREAKKLLARRAKLITSLSRAAAAARAPVEQPEQD